MIDDRLLEVLACPVCKSPLSLSGTDKLKCASCRRVYPIRDGFPILLEEEASIEDA